MFFSCKGKYEDVENMANQPQMPKGVATNFKLVYTDSTKVKAILTSPLSEDYTNLDFGYREFPKGLYVEFFDDQKNKSTVTANYGILYSETGLIDLQGDVLLNTHDGKRLEAPQLYWDQKNEWIFTKEAYTFISDKDSLSGTGVDFNKDFTKVYSRQSAGSAIIEE